MKSWTMGTSKESIQGQEGDKLPSVVVDVPPPPVTEVEGHDGGLPNTKEDDDGHGNEEEGKRKPLWGPCECCISCVRPILGLLVKKED